MKVVSDFLKSELSKLFADLTKGRFVTLLQVVSDVSLNQRNTFFPEILRSDVIFNIPGINSSPTQKKFVSCDEGFSLA